MFAAGEALRSDRSFNAVAACSVCVSARACPGVNSRRDRPPRTGRLGPWDPT